MPEVVQPESRVAQTAYTVGYDHATQFDREFRQLFGLSPTGFRRLWEAHLTVRVDPRLLPEVLGLHDGREPFHSAPIR